MSPPRIELVIDRQAARRWHERLRARLLRLLPGSVIRFRLVQGSVAFPSPVSHLLTLERLLLRGSREALCDTIRIEQTETEREFQPDVVVDCSGQERALARPDGARLFRPLYNGHAGETAAAAALLAGACPVIALEDVGNATLAATGWPSLEAADGLTGGLEAVASRVITLIERTLLSPPGPGAPLRPVSGPASPRGAAVFFLRGLAHNCARRIYHLCCYAQFP